MNDMCARCRVRPQLRRAVAEEIAAAIEATRTPSTEDNSWLLHAARIAREIGSKESAS